MKIVIKYVILSLCIAGFSSSTFSHGTGKKMPKIMAVLAHPDDETWFSGTAAKIAAKNNTFSIVYATSGDAGHDVSGQGLCCEELAIEREKEAKLALEELGVETPPIFLRLPDSKLILDENKKKLQEKLKKLFSEYKPDIIITFGEDGVTGHADHRLVGIITREVADMSPSIRTVLNVAVSKSRAKLMNQYAAELGLDLPSMIPIQPVSNRAIDIRVNTKKYATNRVESFGLYKTQFPIPLMELWGVFAPAEPVEEIIIARKHKKHSRYLRRILNNH